MCEEEEGKCGDCEHFNEKRRFGPKPDGWAVGQCTRDEANCDCVGLNSQDCTWSVDGCIFRPSLFKRRAQKDEG